MLCDWYADELIRAGFDHWRTSYSSGNKKPSDRIQYSRKQRRIRDRIRARRMADERVHELFNKPRTSLILAGAAWWIEFFAACISLSLLRMKGIARTGVSPSHCGERQNETTGRMAVFASDKGLLRSGVEFWLKRVLFSFQPPKTISRNRSEPSGEPAPDGIGHLEMQTCDVAVVGYISAETGLGESVRGIIRALDVACPLPALFDIREHYARSEDREFSRRAICGNEEIGACKTCIVHINADQVPHSVSKFPVSMLAQSERRIGYWYWETESFPHEYLSAENYFDEIWVATSFVREALVRSGVSIPVRIVPPSLAPLVDSNLARDYFDLPYTRPIVLSVFDATSFLGRKNPVGVIRAVQRVYEQCTEKPLLVLKTTNLAQADHSKLLEIAGSVEIKIINAYLSREETLSLIGVADSFVSLHRAEGLGLSLIDAMRLGTPLVATDYSGPKDFANSDNSYLVPWTYCNAQWEDGPYFGSRWAEPDIDVAAKQIECSLRGESLSQEKTLRAKCEVEEYFSRERIAGLLASLL